MRANFIFLRNLLVVFATAFAVAQPVLVSQAPSLESARLEAFKLYGFSAADFCATDEESGRHVHCEDCLVAMIGTLVGGGDIQDFPLGPFRTARSVKPPHVATPLPTENPIRAPPHV